MIINFGIFAKKKTTVEDTVSAPVKVPATDIYHKHQSMALPQKNMLQSPSKTDLLQSGSPGKPKRVRASVRLRDKDLSSV